MAGVDRFIPIRQLHTTHEHPSDDSQIAQQNQNEKGSREEEVAEPAAPRHPIREFVRKDLGPTLIYFILSLVAMGLSWRGVKALFDKDNSGDVTLSELTEAGQAFLDKNGDGEITWH